MLRFVLIALAVLALCVEGANLIVEARKPVPAMPLAPQFQFLVMDPPIPQPFPVRHGRNAPLLLSNVGRVMFWDGLCSIDKPIPELTVEERAKLEDFLLSNSHDFTQQLKKLENQLDVDRTDTRDTQPGPERADGGGQGDRSEIP